MILFCRLSGKYVVNARDLAEVTGLRVQDIMWYISQMSATLESVGEVTYFETEGGVKYPNLNAVQLHLICTKYSHIGSNKEVQNAQAYLIAAVQDDKEIALSLDLRKHQLGIR